MTGRGTLVVVVKGYPRLSETFVAQELWMLERAGFRLLIVSMRRPTDGAVHPIHREIRAPILYLPEYLYQAPLRVLRALSSARQLPGFRLTLRAWLSDLARDFRPSRVRRLGQALVLATEMPPDTWWIYAHFIHAPSAVARYASMLKGLPWSLSAHAKDIWTSPDWELKNHLCSARWVVTCTQAGQHRLNQLAPDGSLVRLVYHGLDFTRFPPPAARVHQRDGLDPKQPVHLLTVCRAVEKKGLDTLLIALAKVPKELNWRITHIGQGPLLKSLRKKAFKLGIADRVQFWGARTQPEVIGAYRASDIFVLPCREAGDGDRDGLPNVLLEALSQRLACISTTVGGIPELIRDGETGLLVPPGDPAELARALATLICDPHLRARLAAAGERHIRANFDFRQSSSTLCSLFEKSSCELNKLDVV